MKRRSTTRPCFMQSRFPFPLPPIDPFTPLLCQKKAAQEIPQRDYTQTVVLPIAHEFKRQSNPRSLLNSGFKDNTTAAEYGHYGARASAAHPISVMHRCRVRGEPRYWDRAEGYTLPCSSTCMQRPCNPDVSSGTVRAVTPERARAGINMIKY